MIKATEQDFVEYENLQLANGASLVALVTDNHELHLNHHWPVNRDSQAHIMDHQALLAKANAIKAK